MEDKENTKEKLVEEIKILQSRISELEKRQSECKHLEEELKKTKDELETQTWGLKKTNDGIRFLYKELEAKNKKLQELDKLKSDFISTVSHELRTPLTITKEGISLVLDEIPGKVNDKQAKVLTTARDSIDRLARIINNLLDISKIEFGRTELRKELVDITSLIGQIVSSFEIKAQKKGLELKVAFKEERIDVYVDVDRIIQVFTNLIGNAIKFTKRGYIEVSAQEKEQEVECYVADTGIGISKEDMSDVFNKFQQFGRISGPGEKGTGLGLAISKEIIELHKGRIWVESESEKGAKFIFTLPKYTTESLFKEYIDNGIKKAMEKGSRVSLIVISIAEFDKVRGNLTNSKIDSLLKDMQNVLNISLRQTGDVVVKNTGEIIVLLVDCDKNGAVKVEGRLEQQLKSYLNAHDLTSNIKLHFGCATYPDEAKSDVELIKKAKKT